MLLVAALDKLCNVDVPLVGDDALGVIVQLLLGGLDVGVDMGHDIGGDAELFQHLDASISLETDKRERFEQMDAGVLTPLKEAILKNGKEIEQELLLL